MFEKTPEGYIRVNLSIHSTVEQRWSKKLISDIIEETCTEYHMNPLDNRSNILYPSGNKLDFEILIKLLKTYKNIDAISYQLSNNLPSFGILVKKDDPIVVEYILKYG